LVDCKEPLPTVTNWIVVPSVQTRLDRRDATAETTPYRTDGPILRS